MFIINCMVASAVFKFLEFLNMSIYLHAGIAVTSAVTMLKMPKFVKAPRINPHGKAKY